MESNKKIMILLGGLLCFLVACQQQAITSYPDYLLWLNNTENGLVKMKNTGGISIKIKQLPSDYLTYQDLVNEKNVQEQLVDSIIKSYDKSLTFLMSIDINQENSKEDIMHKGVRTYEEYKERIMTMNFEIEKNVFLTINGKEYRPVLSNLEDDYGLSTGRNVTFVFVPENKEDSAFYESDEITFTYDDELFDTGINHFKFKRAAINNIPQFIFWN